MKAEVNKSIIVTFDPIVITLTIESEEELHELWHRVDPNLYVVAINEFANKYSTPLPGDKHDQTAGLFKILCECVEKRVKGVLYERKRY